MSQRLDASARKQARETIEDHFDVTLKPDGDLDDIANRRLSEIKRDYKKEMDAVKRTQKSHEACKAVLEKKVGDGFFVSDFGKISIDYHGKHTIARSEREAIRKKNKPTIAAKRKALAKLQSIETREDLAKLFKATGIL